MKKLLTLAVLAVAVVGSAAAQMAIPGALFADNPSRFNGRRVTLKEIQIVPTSLPGNSGVIAGPVAGPLTAAPGPVGSPTAPNIHPCRPPRGFSKLEISFIGKPEYKACFFMADNMKTQLDREMGGQTVDAQITFRGDSRTGYAVTFYRLGR